MLNFGMPAMIELDTVEETVEICAQLGLDFVELNTNFPLQQVHGMDPEKIRDLAQAHGIFYTIHLNDEMPVADFNPHVAEGYRKAVLEVIEFAKQTGIRVLNMHISEGARFTTPQRIIYFYEAYETEYLRGIREFRDACEQAIGDSGIRICIENSKAYFAFQKKALELLLESPVFALTLDTGHNHCSGYADEGWIRERKHHLAHMHLHDAKGAKQDHQPLGQGDVDIPAYLALVQETGCTVLLEVKTVAGLKESVQWIRERGL